MILEPAEIDLKCKEPSLLTARISFVEPTVNSVGITPVPPAKRIEALVYDGATNEFIYASSIEVKSSLAAVGALIYYILYD